MRGALLEPKEPVSTAESPQGGEVRAALVMSPHMLEVNVGQRFAEKVVVPSRRMPLLDETSETVITNVELSAHVPLYELPSWPETEKRALTKARPPLTPAAAYTPPAFGFV